MHVGDVQSVARWLSWLKRLTSNEEIPSSNLGRAFLYEHNFFSFFISMKIRLNRNSPRDAGNY